MKIERPNRLGARSGTRLIPEPIPGVLREDEEIVGAVSRAPVRGDCFVVEELTTIVVGIFAGVVGGGGDRDPDPGLHLAGSTS